jgi:hypothetical protein
MIIFVPYVYIYMYICLYGMSVHTHIYIFIYIYKNQLWTHIENHLYRLPGPPAFLGRLSEPAGQWLSGAELSVAGDDTPGDFLKGD